ncbi:hypothetical protein ES708_17203 [subsurface metagenome]
MRNRNPKMVKILNEETLEFQCKKCSRKKQIKVIEDVSKI